MSGDSKSEHVPWSIWVVYDHPADYPNCYVARRWTYGKPNADVMIGLTLEAVRQALHTFNPGLFCVTRHPNDDPCVVETWI